MFRQRALCTFHTTIRRNVKKTSHSNQSLLSSHLLRAKSTTSSPMQLIKQLRTATGAPMMECKKAIAADGVDGDFDKAAEWLRKNGSAKAASKLAGRDASEGLVGLAIFGATSDGASSKAVGAIVRVASETDFASRSSAFSSLVKTVADGAVALTRNSGSDTDAGDSPSRADTIDVEDILAIKTEGDKSVKDALDDAVLAIRENLQIVSVTAIVPSRSDAVLAGYVHGKVDHTVPAGTAAAIVELVPTDSSSSGSAEEIHDIGMKLAMHIVAAKPIYLSPDEIPEDVLNKEREILMEQIDGAGKSADILDKIVSGRLRKFYEQVCLTEQAHMVEEGNPKINKFMKKLGLEVVQFQSKFI